MMDQKELIEELFAQYGFTRYLNNRIFDFIELLVEENRKYNLASIKDLKEYLEKNLIDSLMVLRTEQKLKGKLIDIGSGNGFPAVILAAVCDDLEVTLLDSNNKKTGFLEKVKQNILPDINILYGRAEDIVNKRKGQYDYVSAKALVSDPKRWLIWTLPFLKKNGISINYKTKRFLEELELAGVKKLLKKNRINLYKTLEYTVADRERVLVLLKK